MGRPPERSCERLRRRARAAGPGGVRRLRRPVLAATTSSSPRERAALRRSTCERATTSTWGWPGTPSMPTVVVGDIDRGGVFAAFVGTVALLSPEDQALVAGFVVNKFRGDVVPAAAGARRADAATGRRVFGVLPWHPDLWLDSEDALDLEGRRVGGGRPEGGRGPAAADQQLHRRRRPRPRARPRRRLRVRPARPGRRRPGGAARAPGDARDLAWMRSRGSGRPPCSPMPRPGEPVLGICGGCQMLGRTIDDPDGVEGSTGTCVDGLGLLDADHDLRRRQGAAACTSRPATRSTTAGSAGTSTLRVCLRDDGARHPGGRREPCGVPAGRRWG